MTEAAQPQRRASDTEQAKTLADIYDLLMTMKAAHDGILSAFVLDDIGKPDYTGHRLAHKQQIADAAAMQSYKTGLTKSILDWAAKGVIVFVLAAILTSGMGYLKDHIK